MRRGRPILMDVAQGFEDKEAPSKRPVLVVEDAADIRETLRELLELDDIPVRTAANGALGLEELDRMPRPCLVLLDLMMPVMDGFQFLKALEERPYAREVQVVLISANRNMDLALRHPTVVAGLKKPFELDELLALVERHCALPAVTESGAPWPSTF